MCASYCRGDQEQGGKKRRGWEEGRGAESFRKNLSSAGAEQLVGRLCRQGKLPAQAPKLEGHSGRVFEGNAARCIGEGRHSVKGPYRGGSYQPKRHIRKRSVGEDGKTSFSTWGGRVFVTRGPTFRMLGHGTDSILKKCRTIWDETKSGIDYRNVAGGQVGFQQRALKARAFPETKYEHRDRDVAWGFDLLGNRGVVC